MGEMEWKCICVCALQEEEEKKKRREGTFFWRMGVITSNILGKWEGNVECLSEDNDDEEDAVS